MSRPPTIDNVLFHLPLTSEEMSIVADSLSCHPAANKMAAGTPNNKRLIAIMEKIKQQYESYVSMVNERWDD